MPKKEPQPRELPNIWASFVRKFVAKSFQKSPNLVTLVESFLPKDSFSIGNCNERKCNNIENFSAHSNHFELAPFSRLGTFLSMQLQTREIRIYF